MTTVTVRRDTPGGTDVYGDPVAGATTTFTVTGCKVAPRMAEENTDRGRQGTLIGVDLFAPPAADIRHTDVVVIPDSAPHAGEYEVEAQPADWRSPSAGGRGLVVPLKRAAG